MPRALQSLYTRPPPCLNAYHTRCRPRRLHPPSITNAFHTSPSNLSDNDHLSHYEVLHLDPAASPAEIKRQFFTLSKKHHPDHNPTDPTASTRFVKISEAYHVLSVPEKRAQYDAQLSESHGRASPRWGRAGNAAPTHGSYSSAQSFAGSRAATGLNKKRGTFRGPPPSFYKAGGYGRHGAKRAEYAHHDHDAQAGGSSSASSASGREGYGDFGGFGPGQQAQGNEVPHFDDQRHKRTHDHIHEHIWSRRRRDLPEDVERGGMLVRFLLVSSVIAIMGISVHAIGYQDDEPEKKDARN